MENLSILCLKKAKTSILDEVYKLNELLAPMVGSLKSPQELRSLINMSSNSFYAIKNDRLVGYIVCFKEKSKYHSQNYRHFHDKYKKFTYIDRIGVPKELENQGIGTQLYNYIFDITMYTLTRIYTRVEVRVPKWYS